VTIFTKRWPDQWDPDYNRFEIIMERFIDPVTLNAFIEYIKKHIGVPVVLGQRESKKVQLSKFIQQLSKKDKHLALQVAKALGYKIAAKVAPAEYEKQLRMLLEDHSPEGEQLKGFIFGESHTTKVKVDPDLRAVLPNFKYNQITDPKLYKKYPDVVFTYNFLIPYLVMMHKGSAKLNVKSLHQYIKAHTPDPPTMLYRAQHLDIFKDSQLIADLRTILRSNFKHVPSTFTKQYQLNPINVAGWARTAEEAKNAMFGSGSFGSGNIGDSIIFKLKVQPIIDIQAYSETVLEAFKKIVKEMPKTLANVKTYGVHEGEVLAPVPKKIISFERDILLIQIDGKIFSPNEFLKGVGNKELQIKSEFVIINYTGELVKTPKGYKSIAQPKKTRIPKKTFDDLIDWFKTGRTDEFVSIGGSVGVDFKANLKEDEGAKFDPNVFKLTGQKVYIYYWR